MRHVSTLSHPNLVVRENGLPCRGRKLHIVEGMCNSYSLKINDPDIGTLRAALLERMFFHRKGEDILVPPTPSKVLVTERLRYFKNKLLKNLNFPPKISPDEFSQMYVGRKRKIYEAAVMEYCNGGVRKEHGLCVCFVKCEKVDPNKAPRCIQPRSPVYNVGLGMYIKPLEHRLYAAIGRVFGDKVTVVKGFNVETVAELLKEKWESFVDPVAVGLDAERFDAHVSAPMLAWEHSVYTSIWDDAELKHLLSLQMNNNGVGYCEDGKLRYKIKGKRFSGDMNTSLGNCLIMCAMVFAWAQHVGVEVKLMNNGDDCQVFMERKNLKRFNVGLPSFFLEMGFRMTVEPPAYNMQEVEFCQMRPIRTARGVTMVRNIERARQKDAMSILDITSESASRKWMGSIGYCGLALCSGVPVMQSMYAAYVRHGKKSNMINSLQLSGISIMGKGLSSKMAQVSDEARLDVFIAWGITPDEQMAIETLYENWEYVHNVRPVDEFDEIPTQPI